MKQWFELLKARYQKEPPHQRRFAFCLALSWILHILFILPGHGDSPSSAKGKTLTVSFSIKKSQQITHQPNIKVQSPQESPLLIAHKIPSPVFAPFPQTDTRSESVPLEKVASVAEVIGEGANESVASETVSTVKNDSLVPWEELASPYFKSSEVDIIAQPIGNLIFDYPIDTTQQQLGEILLEVLVDENGFVVASHVLESTLPESYSELAQAKLAQTQYSPAFKNGVAVKNRKKLLLQFDPAFGFN